jgi:hypothetical protein
MKCCICGTVRECGLYLDNVFKNIEIIGSIFDDYKIFLYYDKSNDNTLEKMREYGEKNNRLYFYVNNNQLSEYRTFRIANGRNKCLDYIRNNCSDYETFIMMDMDGINFNDINIDVLQKYLLREDWDSLSFNRNCYYDIWALSINPYYLSCLHFNNVNAASIMSDYINNLIKNTPPGELLQCASAFNGFAIYRTNKFLNCSYSGRLNLNLFPKKIVKNNINLFGRKFDYSYIEDCEHRSFHVEAIHKNQARIRISSEILFPGTY